MKEMAIAFFTPLFVAVCLGTPAINEYKTNTIEISLDEPGIKKYLSDLEKLKKFKSIVKEFKLENFNVKDTHDRILCEISMYETCIWKNLGEEFYKQIGE